MRQWAEHWAERKPEWGDKWGHSQGESGQWVGMCRSLWGEMGGINCNCVRLGGAGGRAGSG